MTQSVQGLLADIWKTEPKDVQKTREKMVASYGLTTPAIMYGESETRELVDYLWQLRILVKSGKLELEPAKVVTTTFLEYKADKWIRWFKWDEVPLVLRDVSQRLRNASTADEFIAGLEDAFHYVNRFNCWLEANIPWLALGTVGDTLLKARM